MFNEKNSIYEFDSKESKKLILERIIPLLILQVLFIPSYVYLIISRRIYGFEDPILIALEILFVVCLGYWAILDINTFAILENGISPPIKPRKWKYRKGLFIPYSLIEEIKVTGKWKGKKLPKTPYVFTIKTKEGEEFDISIFDFVLYIGENLNELRKIYDLLDKIKNELKRDENRKKFENNEEIILRKELFKEILEKKYDIEPLPKAPKYLTIIQIGGFLMFIIGLLVFLLKESIIGIIVMIVGICIALIVELPKVLNKSKEKKFDFQKS